MSSLYDKLKELTSDRVERPITFKSQKEGVKFEFYANVLNKDYLYLNDVVTNRKSDELVNSILPSKTKGNYIISRQDDFFKYLTSVQLNGGEYLSRILQTYEENKIKVTSKQQVQLYCFLQDLDEEDWIIFVGSSRASARKGSAGFQCLICTQKHDGQRNIDKRRTS